MHIGKKGDILTTVRLQDELFENFKAEAVKHKITMRNLLERAMFFFDKNKLWEICDKGINDAAILALTKRINGGTHGLADRNEKTKKYYEYVK